MDCRPLLLLSLALLSAAGCVTPDPNPANSGAVRGGEKTPSRSATWTAFGDFRVSGAMTVEQKPLQQQLLDDARMAYLKAIDLDPKYLPAYLGLARLHQLCENNTAAEQIFEQALKVDSSDARVWFELGMCRCRSKNWNVAVEALQKSCELDSANRRYSTTLGFTLARAGRYEEAFLALARHNSEAQAHYDLARMLFHQKQLAAARQEAGLAVQLNPALAAANELLAEIDSSMAARPVEHEESAPTGQPGPRR
jgi:tetratricopeptide (TPR) repeat protein